MSLTKLEKMQKNVFKGHFTLIEPLPKCLWEFKTMGANFQLQRNCQDFNMKMKICRVRSDLLTFPSFSLSMYKIEHRFGLVLNRNLLCGALRNLPILQPGSSLFASKYSA